MPTFSPTRYDAMPFRRCGHSGLMLPELSIGCWHNFTQIEPARAMLRFCFDQGITHFDLANNYGPPPGRAEEVVGQILHDDFRGHRDELVISTKAGYRMWPGPYGEWGSRKYLIASLDQSLRRLGLDYVDIFYSHRFDSNTPLDETIAALDHLVRQGKAIYAGISSYDAERTKQAARIMHLRHGALTLHQPSYSMLNRGIENGLLEAAHELGLGVIVFCPLAQGLLTDKYLDGIPRDSRAADPDGFLKPEQITPELIAKLRKLHTLAQARGQTLAQMAITWILRLPGITSVLFGARNPAQIADNLRALQAMPLSDEELQQIDAILNR
jgi:L-glyceraldehyde 3-phosphate reductase